MLSTSRCLPVLAWATLVALLLGNRLSSAEEASTCANPLATFPSTGFVITDLVLPGDSHFSTKALRIEKALEAPWSCGRLRLENVPDGVGTLDFTMVEEENVNGRPYFSNGQHFLSYVLPSDGRPYGIWILGDSPGEDRGVGFVVAPHPHVVPCFEAEQGPKWSWISDNSRWEEAPDSSLTCLDTSPAALLLDASYTLEESLHSVTVVVTDNETSAYIGTGEREWRAIRIQGDAGVPFGIPVHVADGSRGVQCHGTLVNAEFQYTGWRLMFHCHSDGETEVFLDFDDQGFLDGAEVSLMTAAMLQSHQLQQRRALLAAVPGDFFWVFYLRTTGIVRTIEVITAECLSSEDGTALFKYYPDDRRAVMRRSLLSYMDELLIVFSNLTAAIGEHEIEVTSALSLGSDAVLWIREYLIRHEGRFGGLSSCFLYHAAIAMPAPFVYAAEIICVLIGSKPIVMIQVSSSSDHQCKFPLVTFLAHKIIESTKRYPEFPLGYFKSSYRSDETLVIYNKRQAQHANMLLPYRQAQALHIVPYPEGNPTDHVDNDPVLRAQIYNSWWNGYLLGYPERFVDSYCRDFHSELSAFDKLQMMRSAKKDVVGSLLESNLTVAAIHLGLNDDVGERFWKSLPASAVSSQ